MKDWKFFHYHPRDQIIEDQIARVKTRSSFEDLASYAFVFEVEPKTIDKALIDNDWIITMEEELNQFIRNDIWTLVLKP